MNERERERMFVIISNTAHESCNEFHAVFATYAEAVGLFKTPECTEGDMYFGEEIVIARISMGVGYDHDVVAEVTENREMQNCMFHYEIKDSLMMLLV